MRKLSGITLRMRINGPAAKRAEKTQREDEAFDDEINDPRKQGRTDYADNRMYPLIQDDE